MAMETVRENVCCRAYGQIASMLKTSGNLSCVCDLPVFRDNCLNRGVLETSRHEFVEHHGPFGDEHQLNELVVITYLLI